MFNILTNMIIISMGLIDFHYNIIISYSLSYLVLQISKFPYTLIYCCFTLSYQYQSLLITS